MKLSKKLFAVLLAVVLVIACMPAAFARTECPAAAFTDVDTSQYYHAGVDYMLSKGYMTGTSAKTFSPGVKLTRGMVLTALYSMAGKPAAQYKGAFSDVREGAYYALAVEWGAANKIASGYPGGTFKPDQNVTREQLATFLYSFAKFSGVNVSIGEDTNILSYDDALTISEYAIPAIQWACGADVLSGSSNSLLPRADATRAQFAVMAYSYSMVASAPAVKEVQVASTAREDVQIPAYVTLPANYDSARTYPMVIFCHGHGGNHNEGGGGGDVITNGLARAGIIAVTLDYPGCGASKEGFTENTMTNMKHDTLDVVNYVTSAYSVAKGKVGILGYSMGGRIALELLAEKSYSFAAVEFVAPAEDTADLKNLFGGASNWTTLKATAKSKGYADFTTVYGQKQQLSYQWFTDLEKYSDGLAEAAAKNYTGRSMVVYATNDEAVSPSVSAGVAKVFDSAVVNTYADGHSYSFYGKTPYTVNTVNESSVNFFKDELLAKAAGVSGYVAAITGDGSLTLTIPASALTAAGVKTGDTVKATIDGVAFSLPVYATAASAAKGAAYLLMDSTSLTVCLQGGAFAAANKIAVKNVSGSAVQWYYTEASDTPLTVTLAK